MILNTKDNIPAVAPQLIYSETWLTEFRAYMGNINLQKADFLEFITTPSERRTLFLQSKQVSNQIESHRFVSQNFSL